MRAALSDFNDSLDSIRSLANHIATETGAALADPNVLRRHEVQQCACVVLLTGYFESFIKEAVKALIAEICRRSLPFVSLPDRIRRTHIEGGGRVLLSVAKEARRQTGSRTVFAHTTPEDVILRLDSTRANPGGGYDILWEAFASTNANPGPGVVADLLRDLDVQNVWPAIAAAAGAIEAQLTSRLADLIVVRNACAHAGKVSPIPDPSKIVDYVGALAQIAEGIVLVLENRLSGY
jgi:RiboL-PSP-HEPN